jgi:hypothetical protein
MNKKGFLLAETTLKIVIAVICIGFLVYLLVSIYLNNQSTQDLELAEASLDHLISEINLKHTEVEIYNPKGWWISSWSSEPFPNQCSDMGWENCLCICDDEFYKDEKQDCNAKGICLESSASVKGKFIKIDKVPIKLEINDNTLIEKSA